MYKKAKNEDEYSCFMIEASEGTIRLLNDLKINLEAFKNLNEKDPESSDKKKKLKKQIKDLYQVLDIPYDEKSLQEFGTS